MGKDEETEHGSRGSGFKKKMKKQTYDLGKRLLEYTEIAVVCSVLDICFSFDVGRSMFDVGRSSFNVTCERWTLNGEP